MSRFRERGDSGEAVLGLFMSGKTVFEIFSCCRTVFVIFAVNGNTPFPELTNLAKDYGSCIH